MPQPQAVGAGLSQAVHAGQMAEQHAIDIQRALRRARVGMKLQPWQRQRRRCTSLRRRQTFSQALQHFRGRLRASCGQRQTTCRSRRRWMKGSKLAVTMLSSLRRSSFDRSAVQSRRRPVRAARNSRCSAIRMRCRTPLRLRRCTPALRCSAAETSGLRGLRARSWSSCRSVPFGSAKQNGPGACASRAVGLRGRRPQLSYDLGGWAASPLLRRATVRCSVAGCEAETVTPKHNDVAQMINVRLLYVKAWSAISFEGRHAAARALPERIAIVGRRAEPGAACACGASASPSRSSNRARAAPGRDGSSSAPVRR